MGAMNDVQIICTLGPSSLNADVMRRLENRNVKIVRINLSHVARENLEPMIDFMSRYKMAIALDTEGSQIRTGEFGADGIYFHHNDVVKLHRYCLKCDSENIAVTPAGAVDFFRPGDLIELDFNSAVLRVDETSSREKFDYVECRVVIEGHVDSRKGVHCDTLNTKLPPFSEKDLFAFELAKKFGIQIFTLSFMNHAKDVLYVREMFPSAKLYAKIETREGVKNVSEILDVADGILIDRGDLSREIPIEKIPCAQRVLISKALMKGKKAFVASNLIESMSTSLKPTRAEVNDVVSTVIDGVSGFVLTKETAIGKYPVETVNMVENLIQQAHKIQQYTVPAIGSQERVTERMVDDAARYLIVEGNGSLVEAHGGRLVDRFNEFDVDADLVSKLPKIMVSDEVLMDLEMIGVGAFSPLEGFLSEKDYRSVMDKMHLSSGVPWTIPILLTVTEEEFKRTARSEQVAIVSRTDGNVYGVLDVEDVYVFDKQEYAMKVFQTTDRDHPGVQELEKNGSINLGGKVRLLRRYYVDHSYLNLTPMQTRRIFEGLGWSKVVGFHTRNVIHRSHEYMQLEAMQQYGCDGLFVHPVVGKKKKGDYSAEMIIASYELMMEHYYPKNRVVLGVFQTYSRYAGPREAIFTAICRKNYGCSHFIVGRDHTGVGNYYPAKASQDIFSQFGDLGIQPIFFDTVAYSKSLDRYVNTGQFKADDLLHISGTEARRMMARNEQPADWFMRSKISSLIMDRMLKGEEVFV